MTEKSAQETMEGKMEMLGKMCKCDAATAGTTPSEWRRSRMESDRKKPALPMPMCVQEARSKQSGQLSCKDYAMWPTKAYAGTAEVELVMSTKCYNADKDAEILHQDPKRTMARVQLPYASCDQMQAKAATYGLAKPVLANPSVPVQTRPNVVTPYVVGKMLPGSPSWPPLPDTLLARLESALMISLRMVSGHSRDDVERLTDDQVRRKLKVPSVRATLVGRRLLYAARLTKESPSLLLALLQEPTGPGREWRDMLVGDMVLMRKVLSPKLDEMPDPQTMPGEWEKWWAQWPVQWKTLVRLTVRKLAELGNAAFDATQDPLQEQPHHEEEQPQWHCDECESAWPTKRALRSHQAAKHGHRRWVRWYVADGTCPVCRANHWTRLRAMTHLQYHAPRCADAIWYGGLPTLPEEEVERLDALDTAFIREAKRAGRGWLDGPPAQRRAA